MTKRAIYYDTETTGLSAQNDRIVEIAAYDPAEGREFCEFVNPGCPIPAEASSVHHITDDMVADAGTWKEVGPRFADFCAGDVVLVAHNNDAFDVHFLREEFKRNDLEMPAWVFLDTLKWARRYRRDLPKHSLQFLREIYGFPPNQAHRALDDVIMLHKVFAAMTDDLPVDTILELMSQQQAPLKPEDIECMPFGKHRGVPLADVPASYVKWLVKEGAFDKPENEPLLEAFKKAGVISED